MTFAYPNALFLLLLLLPFTVLVIHNYHKKKRLLRQFIGAAAEARTVVRGGREIDFFKSALLTAALALLVLALARPQWGERFEPVDIRGLEIVFLLDTSASMNAEDLLPSRLAVARDLLSAIVDAMHTDLVSLVNFAGSAYVQCPPTLDYEAFKLLVQATPPSPQEEQGTDFAKGLSLAAGLFRGSPSSRKLLVLASDGEDQEQGWAPALNKLAQAGVTVFTVGVGSAAGAPIPLHDEAGRTSGWKKDAQGAIVRSRLDETTLAQMAAQGGGRYFRLDGAAEIAPLVAALRDFERRQLAQRVQSRRIDRFHYPLLLALLLLACETALSDRRVQWRKS